METVREQSDARLNVLLTEDLPREAEYWTGQLSRLLKPQGVVTYIARTGTEAVRVIERVTIHAAVIDLNTPRGQAPGVSDLSSDNLWLLHMLRRLSNTPPVVVVHSPAINSSQIERLLREALMLGVFSVITKPVSVNDLLATFRNLVDRRYRGVWPGAQRHGDGAYASHN